MNHVNYLQMLFQRRVSACINTYTITVFCPYHCPTVVSQFMVMSHGSEPVYGYHTLCDSQTMKPGVASVSTSTKASRLTLCGLYIN